MSAIKKILYILEKDMITPTPFGWYHWLWIILGIVAIALLCSQRKHASEKQLKRVLGIYGIVALTTELLKQLSWSLDVGGPLGGLVWDYSWYSAPFQLCSTPIYVSLLCLCLKKSKLRDHLLSYMALITIQGGLMTMLMPSSCFVDDILVNIHTMWLHCGSMVVGVYLLMTGIVPLEKKSLLRAGVTFLCFVAIALTMNVSVYHSGILGDETFNMFYISPYFTSDLPVFDAIQAAVPYPLFLASYIAALILGSTVIYIAARGIRYLANYVNNGCKAPVHN